jgi:hypothetical protein
MADDMWAGASIVRAWRHIGDRTGQAQFDGQEVLPCRGRLRGTAVKPNLDLLVQWWLKFQRGRLSICRCQSSNQQTDHLTQLRSRSVLTSPFNACRGG